MKFLVILRRDSSIYKENKENPNKKRVKINVGGQIFETKQTTLKLFLESRLANLSETNSDYDPKKKVFFLFLFFLLTLNQLAGQKWNLF